MDTPIKTALSHRYFFSKGSRASDEYDQYWIRYKPRRVMRKRAKEWGRVEWAVQSLMAAALALAVVYHGPPLAVIFLSFVVIYAILSRLQFLLFPTHVSLEEEGMRMHWLRSFCNVSTPLITWDRVSHVSMEYERHGSLKEPAVEFNVITRGLGPGGRLPFFLLGSELSDGWLSADRGKLRLKLDGLASSDDRKRLQLAFQRFLPSYRIEPAVADELNLALRVESYTDLWLEALHSSPARIREETLKEEALLGGGKYQVVTKIGAGGQATVYKALLRKDLPAVGSAAADTVVLKEFILPTQAGVNVRKRVLENIQKEAKLLKNLSHPNIVKLLDFFIEDQRAYVVLEQIDGTTLQSLVEQKGSMKEEEVLNFALQMCTILNYLHSRKPPIIHRDFTPDNLMMARGDIVKLIDFNVAEHLESNSTRSVVGKHSYIPPEQFRGSAIPQSDIYSLGATLYFLLTGSEPEPITCSSPKKLRSDLSDEMNAIVEKATALDSGYRYEDASELRRDLENLRAMRYSA